MSVAWQCRVLLMVLALVTWRVLVLEILMVLALEMWMEGGKGGLVEVWHQSKPEDALFLPG